MNEAKKDTPRAVIVHKATDISDLISRADHQDEMQRIIVKKVVVLSPAIYNIFRENLLSEWGFIRENANFLYSEDTWNCALIRTQDRNEAIIVSPRGFDYARYSGYISDYTALALDDAPVERYAPDREVTDVKRYITQNQDWLDVTQTQKLICGIGEILDSAGGEQDQYYLFSNSMSGFAGFCGDPIGVNDIRGNPLYVGDMTCLDGKPDRPQLVFRHPIGEPFPSDDYVKETKVTRLEGWQNSMMFLRSREFDMISCRDDYRISKQISSRMNTKNQEQGRTGR